MAGCLSNDGLCPEGDAHAGNSKHGQIVGSVTYRNDLLERDVLLAGNLAQQFGFSWTINDLGFNLAADLAIDDVQFIGEDVVDSQSLLQVPGEEGEASRQDCRFITKHLERANQLLCSLDQRNRAQ